MYLLKNKEGNALRRAKSEYQRDRLLAKGYVPVEEKPKQTRRRNNGNGRNKTEQETDKDPEQETETDEE